MLLAVLIAAALSFGLSATAGFGGSIILVPALALVLGTKEGVALAALLLAGNNVVKVALYRRTIPMRKAALVAVLVGLGALVGAKAMVSAPEQVVTWTVIGAFALTFVAERRGTARALERAGTPSLAFASGATSGFSGTSGPLKGVAVRSLGFDRANLVGALSVVSLVGDAVKASVFTEAGLLGADSYRVALMAIPIMLASSYAGKRVNERLGDRRFAALFWCVIAAYTGRLLLT